MSSALTLTDSLATEERNELLRRFAALRMATYYYRTRIAHPLVMGNAPDLLATLLRLHPGIDTTIRGVLQAIDETYYEARAAFDRGHLRFAVERMATAARGAQALHEQLTAAVPVTAAAWANLPATVAAQGLADALDAVDNVTSTLGTLAWVGLGLAGIWLLSR